MTNLAEYKTIIESHQKQMISSIKAMEDFEKRLESKIRKAKIYPNWAVVVFIVSLLIGVGAIMFVVIKYLL